MSSYSHLGFTNMEYTPTATIVMPPLNVTGYMTDAELAAYERQKGGFPWWLLLVAAGAYYYIQ